MPTDPPHLLPIVRQFTDAEPPAHDLCQPVAHAQDGQPHDAGGRIAPEPQRGRDYDNAVQKRPLQQPLRPLHRMVQQAPN